MAEEASAKWKTHKFEEPSKKLKNLEDVETFKSSNTFKEYVQFVTEVQSAVKSKSISKTKDSGKFEKIVTYLATLTDLVNQTPPIQ